MARNLKNAEEESLVEAIRQALLELKQRLLRSMSRDSRWSALRFLEYGVWPSLPPEANRPLSKEEEEALLGYGPDGAPI
jgi:antitoxin VapB